MNSDTLTVILGFCDCGSFYKTTVLVCKDWNRVVVTLFPTADVLFANPLKTLMKFVGYEPKYPSRWLTYQENVDIYKWNISKRHRRNLDFVVVIGDVDGVSWLDALEKGLVFDSCLLSDDKIIQLFTEVNKLGDFDILVFNKIFEHQHTDKLSDFSISKIVDLPDYPHHRIVKACITKGIISYECVKDLAQRRRINPIDMQLHKDHGVRFIDHSNYKNLMYSRSGDYAICSLTAGSSVDTIWKELCDSATNDGEHELSTKIHKFLIAVGHAISMSHFYEVLYPQISDRITQKKINVIMISVVSYCNYTWKDVMFYSKHYNSNGMFNFITQKI